MKRRLIFILTVMLILFLPQDAESRNTQISINQTTFVGATILRSHGMRSKMQTVIRSVFISTPFSDGKRARSIELTDTSWDGSMSAGQYDIVVYALRRGNASDVSQVISITVESESVPSWMTSTIFFLSRMTSCKANTEFGLSKRIRAAPLFVRMTAKLSI
jgi:hypothetical protein